MPKPNLIRYQEMSQYEQWLLKARALQRYEDKCDRYEALLYRNVLHNDRMMMESSSLTATTMSTLIFTATLLPASVSSWWATSVAFTVNRPIPTSSVLR